jgi:hypothetical protein
VAEGFIAHGRIHPAECAEDAHEQQTVPRSFRLPGKERAEVVGKDSVAESIMSPTFSVHSGSEASRSRLNSPPVEIAIEGIGYAAFLRT